MATGEKPSKAKMLILATRKRITDEEILDWQSAIYLAEETAGMANSQKLLDYIINYRVASDIKLGPTADERRVALIRLIESMPISETHYSTSTFIIRSFIDSSSEISDLLSKPINSKLDFLSVARVSQGNRTQFGNADLQS